MKSPKIFALKSLRLNKRLIHLFMAALLAVQGSGAAATPLQHIPLNEYNQHVHKFLEGFKPDTIWDRPTELAPSELEQKWTEAFERTQGQLLANNLSDIEKAENFDLWIERLRRSAFYGDSAIAGARYFTNHPLDVFGLLGQEVKLKKVGRLRDFLRAATRQFELKKNVSDYVRDVRNQAEGAQREEPIFKSIDWQKLTLEIVQTAPSREGSQIIRVVQRINPEGKDISFLNPESGAVSNERAFTLDRFGGARGETYRFQLSYQGQIVHEFSNNISGAAVLGKYLVFIEPGRASRDLGLVNLSFIDMDYFSSAVGKTVLPIFRLPVNLGENAARNVENLKLNFTERGIEIEDKVIAPEIFDFFSQMQQSAFNLSVSLVDPQYYASTAPLVESTVDALSKALDAQAESMSDELDRAGVSFDLYREFRDHLKEQLKLRSQVGSSGSESSLRHELDKAHSRIGFEAVHQLDRQHVAEALQRDIDMTEFPQPWKDLSVDALTGVRLGVAQNLGDKIATDVKGHLRRAKNFGEQLAVDRSFQESLAGVAQTTASQRRLANRIDLLWTRMLMPQPLGAPKIQQALGLIAAGAVSKDSWAQDGVQKSAFVKEGLKQLFANPEVRVALPVLTGAALAMIYPAETAQFYYQGLDVARNLLDGFLGWGQNWMSITKEAWRASWAWLNPGLLWETYVAKDRFFKLSTGVGVLYGSLLATAGTLHTVINSYHYIKAMRSGEWAKYREQGLGFWATFKRSFVEHIDKEKKRYNSDLAKAQAKQRGQDIELIFPDGKAFRGLFKNLQQNNWDALASASQNRLDFQMRVTLPSGQQLKAALKPIPEENGRAISDEGLARRGLVKFAVSVPGDGIVARVLDVESGDWRLLLDENVLAEEGVIHSMIHLPTTNLVGGLQSTQWSEAENREIATLIENLEKQDEGMLKKLEAMKNVPGLTRLFKKGNGDIETLGAALRHFAVGYSSWRPTIKAFGMAWNPWFLVRNIWYRVRSWMTLLAYPHLFNRMVWNEGVATYYDGGKRPIYETKYALKLADMLFGKNDENFNKTWKELEAFERDIVPVEVTLQKAAMKRAFLRLVEKAASDPEVIGILGQGGNVHPFDPKFKTLHHKQRIYFQNYFTEAFNRSIGEYLQEKTGLAADGESQDERELKKAAAASGQNWAITDSEADALILRTVQKYNVDQIASRTADDFIGGMWNRVKLDHWKKVTRGLDSRFNYSLNRYKIAATQLQNDEALARATRSYLTGLVVDKPIEMLFNFLFLAGIDQGVMKPLYDDAFSENSAFYLSRYVWWNGYFAGIIISLLADPWMKLQMDHRIDSMGGFNDVPTAEEYKKGYLRYYRKQLFAPDNKWWDQQKLEMKLSWVNMPAYFMTQLLTNILALKRFDLDAFMSVYMGSLLPTGGWAYKMDQAFEKSANYVIGAIPTKYHVDPRVQEYRGRAVGAKRLKFNLLYKTFYENPIGNLVGNWMYIPVDGIGPRAWVRQFFGGDIPTEIVVNKALRPLGDAAGGAVKSMADGCEFILTNKHTDAIKILPRSPK